MTSSASAAPLRTKFRELEEERERTWEPAALAVNVNQRTALIRDHGKTASVVKAGDVLPQLTLPAVDGSTVSLDDLVAKGPAVLVFFRFAGCPACNIALPHYRDTLWPELKASGIPLLAISPQPTTLLSEIATRHDLPFPIATDTGLKLTRALGLSYTFDEASRQSALAKGGKSEALNGLENTWELPKPAVIVIGPGRVVRFADVSPDWMDRTESDRVLAALGLEKGEASHAA
ncbi:peroxiredoxin-like family protein [Acetobacter sp.]|uniref:peroxiredoxin-like family protein n=1 Tax=Acetobacter sp. TaxID=440 RepID=UPI0025BC16DF|nr:peroxiredoxin-like family protein [Acetobacter sp.]MCH4092656.1 AhpC/TSA family protein [Acetobacter sp.]MCI1299790.1 AhpC/TSA family protein [Acetobacter sp.]MCI1315330.1 AhpC/TSA family protein [Acetobacter sp.]